MRPPDFVVAASGQVLAAVLPDLRAVPGTVSDPELWATTRQLLDALLADTRKAARSTTLETDLATVLDGYRRASSTPRFVVRNLQRLLNTVRAYVIEETVTGAGGMQRRNELAMLGLIEAYALANMSLAVRDITLRSHDEAGELRARMAANFDAAMDRASDRLDLETVRALRSLLAVVVRDLIERGRPLSVVGAYTTNQPLPAVVLAHLLYQDASRGDELALQNETDHPSFMPITGRALSS